MSNPVSRYINNAFDAGQAVQRAANKHNRAESAKKELKDEDKVKSLNPRQKKDLETSAKNEPKAEKAVSDARGQFFGALLQNRTYDNQGRIQGTQAGHHVTNSKNHTRKVKGD